MEDAIRAAFVNFPLTLLTAGLVAALVSIAFAPKPITRARVAEELLAFYLLVPTCIGFFYNFVMHVFFGTTTARFIGWDDSPFQAEVGFASLGFAAVAFLAFRGSAGMRLAAIVGPAFFLWGAAAGHIRQIIEAGNLSPGNAGLILWMDILSPIIGFALYGFWRRATKMAPDTTADRFENDYRPIRT